jgi:hypothetical protein
LTHNNIFLIRQNKTVAVVLFLLKLAAVFACSAPLCMQNLATMLKQKQLKLRFSSCMLSSALHAKACFCLSKNTTIA